jgi:hypothetical protein
MNKKNKRKMSKNTKLKYMKNTPTGVFCYFFIVRLVHFITEGIEERLAVKFNFGTTHLP